MKIILTLLLLSITSSYAAQAFETTRDRLDREHAEEQAAAKQAQIEQERHDELIEAIKST